MKTVHCILFGPLTDFKNKIICEQRTNCLLPKKGLFNQGKSYYIAQGLRKVTCYCSLDERKKDTKPDGNQCSISVIK